MGQSGPRLVLSTSTSLRNDISNQLVDYLNFLPLGGTPSNEIF